MAIRVVTTPEQAGITTSGMLALFNRCITLGYTWYIDEKSHLCCEPSEAVKALLSKNITEV